MALYTDSGGSGKGMDSAAAKQYRKAQPKKWSGTGIGHQSSKPSTKMTTKRETESKGTRNDWVWRAGEGLNRDYARQSPALYNYAQPNHSKPLSITDWLAWRDYQLKTKRNRLLDALSGIPRPQDPYAPEPSPWDRYMSQLPPQTY